MDDFRISNRDGVVKIMIVTDNKYLFPHTYTDIKPLDDGKHCLTYVGANAIDTLLMNNTNPDGYIESLLQSNTSFLPFKYSLIHELAIPPYKTRPSDTGFNLSIISTNKTIGKVTLYGTGIVLQPPTGYYFEMVPRICIIKTGYVLANNVGVIDQGYTGEIMVPLVKIDDSMPDLELPSQIVQLIARKWIGLYPVEVRRDEITTVKRAYGDGTLTDTIQ